MEGSACVPYTFANKRAGMVPWTAKLCFKMSIFHVQISSEIMREADNRPFQRSRFVLRMLFILLAFFQVSSLAYNLNLNEYVTNLYALYF